MYLHIFVAILLFITISSLEYNLYHFSNHDKESLMMCIENSEYLEDVKKLRGTDVVHTFAKFAAQELSGRTNEDLLFLKDLIKLFKKEPNNFPSTSTGVFWNKKLEFALVDAMIRCSDDYNFIKCLDKYHMTNRRLVPNFESEREQPKTTRLVNLGAVSFSEDLRSMAETPYGFIILMTFADDFVIAIANAYKSLNSNANDLRIRVRRTWQIRAVNHCPLFRYYYDARSGDVYTCGCAKIGENSTQSWECLLEKVTPEELSNVIRLFQSNPIEGRGDFMYNRYEADGMREFERELELLLIQKYRITVFIYELRVRGILTDQTDVIDYDFLDRIPQYLWELLNDDDVYIAHLTSIREFFLFFLEFNHLEEEIILFLNSEVNSIGPRYVRHAESLVYDFPSGIYAAYVSAKTNNNTTSSSNATITTTTIRPTSKNSIFKNAKNRIFKYFSGKRFGNRKQKSHTTESHRSGGTINMRAFDSSLTPYIESVSSNEARQEIESYGDCYTNFELKDETIFLRSALSFYIMSKSCTQSVFRLPKDI